LHYLINRSCYDSELFRVEKHLQMSQVHCSIAAMLRTLALPISETSTVAVRNRRWTVITDFYSWSRRQYCTYCCWDAMLK